MRAIVGNIHRTAGVHGQPARLAETRSGAGTIGRAAGTGRADQSAHRAGGSDLAYRAIVGVGDIDVVCTVHRNAHQPFEPCGAAGAVTAAVTTGAARQRGDDAGGGDLANRVIAVIGHVNIAAAVHCDTARLAEFCGGTGTVGATLRAAGTGQSRDDARRRDLANDVVGRVGNIKVAAAIECRAERLGETRRGPGAIGPAPSACRAGEGGDDTR